MYVHLWLYISQFVQKNGLQIYFNIVSGSLSMTLIHLDTSRYIFIFYRFYRITSIQSFFSDSRIRKNGTTPHTHKNPIPIPLK